MRERDVYIHGLEISPPISTDVLAWLQEEQRCLYDNIRERDWKNNAYPHPPTTGSRLEEAILSWRNAGLQWWSLGVRDEVQLNTFVTMNTNTPLLIY